MIDEVLIAGFGGQGIMLMGRLLAYGAIYEALQVTFYPSYGPEMRGGTANCTVVISNERIGSPVRDRFTHLMAMNQASLDKFEHRVKPNGVVAYNETLISDPPKRADIQVLPIPANRIAADIGNPQVANMAAIGGLIPTIDISLEAFSKGLPRVLPEYRHHLIPVNQDAIKRGMAAVLEREEAL